MSVQIEMICVKEKVSRSDPLQTAGLSVCPGSQFILQVTAWGGDCFHRRVTRGHVCKVEQRLSANLSFSVTETLRHNWDILPLLAALGKQPLRKVSLMSPAFVYVEGIRCRTYGVKNAAVFSLHLVWWCL